MEGMSGYEIAAVFVGLGIATFLFLAGIGFMVFLGHRGQHNPHEADEKRAEADRIRALNEAREGKP